MTPEVLRVIDANFNRAREGLRVCEDVTRFILNAQDISRELKSIRHAISRMTKTELARPITLCGARDAKNDVGRALKAHRQMRRSDYADIFAANIERVKESLRVLEEFFALTDARASRTFSRLRYKTYDVEKRALARIAALRNPRPGKRAR